MEYPKINTLWKRDDNKNIIRDDYSCKEFGSFKQWHVEEKIDGTNIRIFVNQDNTIDIKGRTNKSNVPPITHLIQDKFNYSSQDKDAIALLLLLQRPYILFGEGFGGNIQHGSDYRPDISFILFDVYTNNGHWGTREEVKAVANALKFEMPPDLGLMTEEQIITFVKSKPHGRYNNNGYPMEGIIARSEPLVRFNDQSANPVVWKLKVRDFK